jgi:hypothetical protein
MINQHPALKLGRERPFKGEFGPTLPLCSPQLTSLI